MRRVASSRNPDRAAFRAPGLQRRTVVLADGHRVGVVEAVSWPGATGPSGGGPAPGGWESGDRPPLVLVHGFSGESMLYGQALLRLAELGFRTVAVDIAGHGVTQSLPATGSDLDSYSTLLARTLDHLGVSRAVLVGHSLGGRLVAQLAAAEPYRAAAVVLVDATVGETWDRLVGVVRTVPPVLVGVAGVVMIDAVSTLPVVRDPAQAVRLGRRVGSTAWGHARRPWRLVGPARSLLGASASRPLLRSLGLGVPVVVIHGDRDLVVPYATAWDAARATRGWLVTVHGGTHAWMLKDPATLPAIVGELAGGPLPALRQRAAEPAAPRYRWTVSSRLGQTSW
jgi:pimeloyl-ACP methyl ester carboxylesterase